MPVRFRCPLCSQDVDVPDAQLGAEGPCPACGGTVFFPAVAAPMAYYAPPPQSDGTLGGLIPYKNQSALISYYFGVFSVIPCLAIPLGIAAFVLGIKGLRLARLHPEAKGKAHAWVGIIAGGFFALINLIAVVGAIVASVWA